MEFRRWLLFFGAACLFALSGCSKDEKQVSLQEIEGKLTFRFRRHPERRSMKEAE